MLDGRGQREDVGWSREDMDGAVGVLLHKPLAGRREDSGVQEPPTNQNVRPGAGLSGGRLG
ncbi:MULTISPECIES: hypothetical protein [unclassified Streptomyces]|uniref:hypothetical protein n=1 Tax=unclassified Streptomyces TaxID=2593676 RepID=UPI002E17EE7D|nr:MULTISPECIES: hypothetical protein [unclassified Streptomyces]